MAEQVEYDCSPWAGETRRVLRSVLEDQGIPFAFQGTVLVVPAELEETVDELVEVALGTAEASIDASEETVAFDISTWSGESQNWVVDELVDAGISYEWNSEGHVVVQVDHAEQIEGLLDDLGEPDGGEEMSGLELNERLSSLFVLVDRLCNDPHDRKARKRIPKAAAVVRRVATPFGVEPEEWRKLQRTTSRLADVIADPTARSEPVGHSDGATDDGATDDGATGDGATDDGATDDGATGDGATDDGATGEDAYADPVEVVALDLRDRLRRFV
ncbi:MAG: hypothetical protein ACK5O2_06515 [Microthrixaceae bacterium]